MAKKNVPEMGYSVGQWSGLAQYQCKQCAFDTLDLDTMLEHLVQQHSPAGMFTEPLREIEGERLIEPGEVAQGIYEVPSRR